MKKSAALIFIAFIFSLNAFADIPPPPVGEQLKIEVQQNYPDYQFYIASYDLKVVPNPNPPHVSRPNMTVNIPDTFKLRKIELSTDKPLIEAITSARIQNRGTLVGKTLWLVAVKRSVAGDDIESRIKSAIDKNESKNSADGIYAGYLYQSLESRKDERVGAKVVVNKVTKLDDTGLTFEVTEGTSIATLGSAANCFGLGFLLTGLAFVGFWFARRR